MGKITFNAKRSLLSGHSIGQLITLEIDFTEAVRSRAVRKNVHRASGGATETIYTGADTQWSFTIGPFETARKLEVAEFMDSTAEGEMFRVWPYGEEDSPDLVLDILRTSDGYTISRVLTGTTRAQDLHAVAFSGFEFVELES